MTVCATVPSVLSGATVSGVLDSYGLSSMQKGMLLHALLGSDPGADVEQMVCVLNEDIQPEALQLAWQKIIARHDVFRTAFRTEGTAEPVQEVHATTNLIWREEDWRDCDDESREIDFAAWLKEDRVCPFDFRCPPLARLVLFRFSEQEFRLVWTFHHILLDGRSILTVLREVFSIYESTIAEADPNLPPMKPYGNFLKWLARQEQQEAEKYFRKLLSGFLGSDGIPLSVPIPAEAGHAEAKAVLSSNVIERMTEQAKNLGITLNTFVQGAWAILLGRYCRKDDIVFGAVRAGRHWGEENGEGYVGLFINTLPVRVRIHTGQTAGEWLKDLRRQHLDIRPFEHTDMSDVFRWSEIDRGKVLFDTLVMFEGFQLNDLLRTQGGSWLKRSFALHEQASVPLSLACYVAEDGLSIILEYEHRRFSAGDMERMVNHYCTVLQALVSNPEQTLGEIPLLSQGEIAELEAWNNTAHDFPKDLCAHQLFEQQVMRAPHRIAVEHLETRLTYDQLNRYSNQVAHHLIEKGTGPGSLVGLCVERSVDMIVGLLAVLKAGAAYMPLDPEYPQERLRHMISDAAPQLVLAQAKSLRELPIDPSIVVLLDRDHELIAKELDSNPICRSKPQDPVYVIYTSGSTGKPKGIPCTHEGVVNLITAAKELYGFQPDDRLLQLSTINFDAAVEEIFCTLTLGATLVLRTQEALSSTTDFVNAIERCHITVLDLSTAFWHEWVHGLMLLNRPIPETLRLLIIGGDKASASVYQLWRKIGGDRVCLVNTYGPSETTVVVSYHVMNSAASHDETGNLHEVPIGRPIYNTSLHVLDQHLRTLPVNIPGELYVGGIGVSPGYLNRPDLTSAAFVTGPFAADPPIRLYKTGDLVSRLENGEIEFLGRVDFQVKVRGFRIELGEIERALEKHPHVAETVVVATEASGNREKSLIAYFIPQDGQPSSDELRRFLKQRLPEYMTPSVFVPMENFPLTPNGKVDRQALPDITHLLDTAANDRMKPRTPVEVRLLKIWRQVLNIERIGTHDNFFDLGGHSLLTIKVIDLAHKEGFKIRPEQFFQNPTIAGLAEMLLVEAQGDKSEEWDVLVTLQAQGARPPLYLIHTTPGDLLGYGTLVNHLGTDQPCYGFQSLGLGCPDKCHRSIQEMAAYYVKTLLARQPSDPYLLAGWCYGGVVAFEMAQQLLQHGRNVAWIGLIDAWAPVPKDGKKMHTVRQLNRLLKLGPFGWFRYLAGKIRYLRRVRNQDVAEMLQASFGEGPLANREKIYPINMAAVRNYEGKFFNGTVTLFISEERNLSVLESEDLDWGNLAAKVEIHKVPSSHMTVLQEPGVTILAEQIRACLKPFAAT